MGNQLKSEALTDAIQPDAVSLRPTDQHNTHRIRKIAAGLAGVAVLYSLWAWDNLSQIDSARNRDQGVLAGKFGAINSMTVTGPNRLGMALNVFGSDRPSVTVKLADCPNLPINFELLDPGSPMEALSQTVVGDNSFSIGGVRLSDSYSSQPITITNLQQLGDFEQQYVHVAGSHCQTPKAGKADK